MSSHLDRAFVKAYTRSHRPAASPARAGTPNQQAELVAPATNLESRSDSAGSVQWNQFADETYFRVDVGHTPSMRSNLAPLPPSITSAPRTQPLPPSQEASPAPSLEAPASHRPAAPPSDHSSVWVEQRDGRLPESRLDEAHGPRTWTPPGIEEPQEYYRVSRDVAQAEAFARAKMKALSSEPAASASNPAVAVAAPVGLQPFEPVWEVDAFEFSDTIVALFGDARLMKSIGTPLDSAVTSGLRSLLITSGSRCEGRTSVAVGIAVSAAAAGLKVVLVEADSSATGFADTLRMEVQHDWIEAIRGGVGLGEVAIHSIEDQLTVMPVVSAAAKPPYTAAEFDRMLAELRQSFDLIVVDGAPWGDAPHALQQATAIDAAIVVVDARHRDTAKIQRIQSDLRQCGVAGLGIVENFV
ncbi:MAG: hypothetical protein ACO1RT_06500 [Planctomycetaceae bacterium]